ncbi:MAG: WD40/YVTN/BNR-like repeat-containing protein, partial [Gemmatimonadales bacterium]
LLALVAPALLGAQVTPPQRQPFPRRTLNIPPDSQARPDTADRLRPGLFAGLRVRPIGPATASGRIGEIAIHPSNRSTWYVAVHSGGVWKTMNAGTTWTSIFDSQNSYSIGTIAVDPNRPLVVWVGTGENNSQRSVGYGDGVYKSTDAGRSWTNAGLKNSNHIGKILIDPRNSDVVYVSAIGPLWSSGGDRGVFKTTDGGKTWTQSLKGDEWTGAYDLAFDPRNPDILFATTYQRARRQWGFIDGGPGSAIWKSTDAGASWVKLTRGLPNEELGKIGIAVSSANPDIVYAIVEAANRTGGFFRSTDGGQNWERMSPATANPPFYYHKLYADPKDPERVYSMNVQLQVTEDGGRTFRSIQGRSHHVDNHALWIDPDDTRHLINGNDGGLYESFDRGATWRYTANLPVVQFYRVDVSQSESPFYLVCGGTQDNNTWCGPSGTATSHGVVNSDWFITVGGDGFVARIDPEDPNTIYSESQHGEMVRYDRSTGERIGIQPQPDAAEPASRWHWDSPLIISPHSRTRLYFGSQRLFRSDDRGDSWRPISPDLSRQLDRNKLQMMGRVWSVDAVAKNTSTSFFGAIVSLSESPMREGLLYAGTDDGLIHITENAGGVWRKAETYPGVPEMTFVSTVAASRHDPNTVYAGFNNHKAGDYKPYLLKSPDGGRTWTSIAGNLPERGSVWSFAEDHVSPNLLFVGTEFGAYFTLDGGRRWIKLGGLPTIAVRDLTIHRRNNDLVLATFGRGFWILDDYSPLRDAVRTIDQRVALLPVPEARVFVPASPLGGGARGAQGDAFYTAPNPPSGAVFTWFLRNELRTLRARRQAAERAAVGRGQDTPYPSLDSLRAEAREEPPAVILTVSDEQGNVIRRLTGPTGAGYHRVAWDLRYPAPNPVTAAAPPGGDDADGGPPGGPRGPLVPPGSYQVSLALRQGGREEVVGTQRFTAVPLRQPAGTAADRAAIAEFNRQTARLQRAALGTNSA